MPGKRPLGPVIRSYTPEESDVVAADLARRMEYLEAGAALGANLVVVARERSVGDLYTAVSLLTRDQHEAAVMAFALLAASGTPVRDE